MSKEMVVDAAATKLEIDAIRQRNRRDAGK